MDRAAATRLLRLHFSEESKRHGLRGMLGAASFREVYERLIPAQKRALEEQSGSRFQALMEEGSIISVGYSYPDSVIDNIALETEEGFDKDAWNIYSRWYDRLNAALNATAEAIAREIHGTPIPATLSGIAADIEHVHDYFGLVVSHRVPAEQAGLGWRGRNGLVVNPRYSCAVRFASVLTDIPLVRTMPLVDGCGGCRSCLEACTFLRFKDRLDDYREQCRRYMVHLALESEVCGKCIKACVNSPVFRTIPEIARDQPLDQVFYTFPE